MDHCTQLAPGRRSEPELHRELLPSQAGSFLWGFEGREPRYTSMFTRSHVKRSLWLQQLGDLILWTHLIYYYELTSTWLQSRTSVCMCTKIAVCISMHVQLYKNIAVSSNCIIPQMRRRNLCVDSNETGKKIVLVV